MATVYTARDEKHQRSVAIKVLHPGIADEVFAERFLREIRIAAQFSHPGILGLIDSGSLTVDGAAIPYYVMPLVDGETLRSRMAREGQLSIDDAVDITRQVAEALAYAHAHEVVHRDIKPENILLTGNRVLVADFGIAKAVSNATSAGLTAEGGMLGTPAYMSPEQITDAKVGPASDVFSLGVLFYELLTGELPFAGITPQTQMARRLHDTPTPVRKLRPAISPSLDRTVAMMLSRSPKDRYQTGDQVVEALSTRSTDNGLNRGTVALAMGGMALLLIAALAIRQFGGSLGLGKQAVAPLARSIAVLPFANVGTDSSSEYYGDGIADELAGSLAKLPGLRVAARSSAFQFKGKNVAASEVAERLGVAAVVEGSVRPMGKQIRITAQLVNASDGLAIWSENYERSADEVFNVQADITAAIASALGLAKERVVRKTVTNSRAYEAFLQGRWHWNKRNREGFERAIQYFNVALKEDSSYADAWAGLGDAYSLQVGYGYRPNASYEQARTAAMRAIALDSTLPDAHTALGFIHLFYDRDWAGAKRELETAQRLNPKYGEARLFYAWYLLAMNRADEAVDSLRSAVRDEPVSVILNLRLGSILMLGGHLDAAKVQLRHTLELAGANPLAYLDLARIAAIEGKYAEAFDHLSHAPERVQAYASGLEGFVLARSGKRKEALAEAERLKQGFGPNVSALGAAQVYGALGDFDKAFEWLEHAYENHDWSLFFARSDPLLVPLHGDRRWAPFIARLNFP